MAWIFSAFPNLNVLLLKNFDILSHIFLIFLTYSLFGLANKYLKKVKWLFDTLIFYLTKRFLSIHGKSIFMKTTTDFLCFYEKLCFFKFPFLFPFYFIFQELLNYFLLIIYLPIYHSEYLCQIFSNISIFHSHSTNLKLP